MNKPNILSNELDQVPKTRKWYQKELDLNKDLKQQIIDAFDTFEHDDFPMGENDFFIGQSDKKVLDWFLSHSKDLPVEQVAKLLREHKIVSCEIQRKKKEKSSWWNTALGQAIPKDTIHIWKVLTKNDEVLEWNIITYLTFTKLNDKQQRPDVKISTQQIEFPWEWAMLPEYVVFTKELTWEELEKEEVML